MRPTNGNDNTENELWFLNGYKSMAWNERHDLLPCVQTKWVLCVVFVWRAFAQFPRAFMPHGWQGENDWNL